MQRSVSGGLDNRLAVLLVDVPVASYLSQDPPEGWNPCQNAYTCTRTATICSPYTAASSQRHKAGQTQAGGGDDDDDDDDGGDGDGDGEMNASAGFHLAVQDAPDIAGYFLSDIPELSDEVQIAVRATGLCGSDLHYYRHGRNGSFVLRQPLVLGHESVGEVVAVGSSSDSFRIGDRVALEVGLPCRKCLHCRLGRYNICRSLRFRSSAAVFPHLDGTLMDITNHRAAMCHHLPDSISDVQGALLEPLAVCLHAINRSNPPTAEDVALAKSVAAANGGAAADSETAVLIFGAGAIGLLLASALAITQHFTTIVLADINQARLDIASSLPFGCIKTCVLDPPSSTATSAQEEDQAAKDLAAALLRRLGFDHGFSRVFESGIYASSAGGVVVQIGMGGSSLPSIPMSASALREVDLIGVFRYNGRCYPAAIELASSPVFGQVADKVATHTVELGEEDGQKAFRLASSDRDDDGKAVVKVVVISGEGVAS
ncbi:Zinc-dependent alcohol dehydrogenase [Trichophyton interdigitale]|uniref:Zinc-dependent alcohol dehydrogenase n=1 Tax=Trichophyton interdigitale TaxID=101480 RepID=A0A9P4YGM5_9EURO|nr:Zinc-dependent alcohol dehydrogenase [Trichophyton interdigitale]